MRDFRLSEPGVKTLFRKLYRHGARSAVNTGEA